ncbi:GRAM domain protein/ABA-responsive-like protein [Medicago truncatula]|uniref:GRAM domain protein/ABA-responsive-like protein n=1 Tax=Medicago truncatula TaxID=3880 RepID=A0A072VR17_MEDTR|nr:GRAM domain protein/ABA-responsive-like protein [Medicago truncatula]
MQISLLHELVSGTPIIFDQFQNSVNRYLLDSTSHQCQYPSKHQSKSLTNSNKKRLARKADSLSQKVQEHVRLRANISETIKRKLSLGAQILQVGGVEKVFMRYFSVSEDESLLKISQCYLSTTSGPLAGLLFISNEKVAFCSDRSIKVYNQKGQMCRIRYKVSRELYKYIKKPLHISQFPSFEIFLCIGRNSAEEGQVCEAKSKC